MKTCCPVPLAHATPVPSPVARKRRYGFASLLKIFNQPGLPSIDLADSLPPAALQPPRPPAATVNQTEFGPMPGPDRPAHTKLIYWRLD